MGRISQRSLKRAGKEFDLYFKINNMTKEKMNEINNLHNDIVSLNRFIQCYKSSNLKAITLNKRTSIKFIEKLNELKEELESEFNNL